MSIRQLSHTTLALALTLLTACVAPRVPSANSGTGMTPAKTSNSSLLSTVDTLAAKGDPASLASAALLADVPANSVDPETAEQLRQRKLSLSTRAADRAGDQPMYLWIQLQLCRQTEGCDALASAQRLQRLDPDNAATWLVSLDDAERAGNAAQVNAVLQRMTEAHQFNEYWGSIAVAVFAALSNAAAELPNPWHRQAEFERLAAALALANATIQAPNSVRGACTTLPMAVLRARACGVLARSLQQADTVLVQEFGYQMQRQSSAPPTLNTETLQSYRAFEWRRTQTPLETGSDLRSLNRAAQQRLELMQRYAREDDVDIALLTARHIALDPPLDWMPP